MLERIPGQSLPSTTRRTWRSRTPRADPVAGSGGGSVTHPLPLEPDSPALGGHAIRRYGSAAASCPDNDANAASTGDGHAPCADVRQPGRPKAISVRRSGAGSRRNATSH